MTRLLWVPLGQHTAGARCECECQSCKSVSRRSRRQGRGQPAAGHSRLDDSLLSVFIHSLGSLPADSMSRRRSQLSRQNSLVTNRDPLARLFNDSAKYLDYYTVFRMFIYVLKSGANIISWNTLSMNVLQACAYVSFLRINGLTWLKK